MSVFVFERDAQDFGTLGLCGPLTAAVCDFLEQRNGLSVLTLDHPIDDAGRWATLIPGRILSAEVPVRNVTEINEDGSLVTTVEKWLIRTTASASQRRLMSKDSGGKNKKTLSVWADKAKTQRYAVTVTRKLARYRIMCKHGTGWISPDALEYSVTETIPNDPTAIELVEPAWTERPQLFRIREVTVREPGVSVTASHISYDLHGNLTTWSGDVTSGGVTTNNPTCLAALAGLMGGCAMTHEFVAHTNLLDRRAGISWERTRALEALLAPETGLLDRWGAELVRDDYDLYVLREAGLNRGVEIVYAKNLLGVDCTTDLTELVTRIQPVGKTAKGKPLLLVPGSYEVNGQTVVIGAGESWVTSPNAGNFPAPMMDVLDTGVKAKSTYAADVLLARRQMIEAALNKFADDKCDEPALNLRVDFVSLGDTVEYEQYKRLDDVYLCDRVRVRHPGIGVDVLTEVIEAVWDCLARRFKSIELGKVRRMGERSTVPVWQLPKSIPGSLIVPDSLDGGALADETVSGDAIDPTSVLSKVLPTYAEDTAAVNAEINQLHNLIDDLTGRVATLEDA